jgi:hypothetical protein
MTTAAAKIKAKRARRPVYLMVAKLVDPRTGEEVGALIPANDIDRRLMKERRFAVGKEIRAELKQPRNPAFHRLAHAIGNLLVDNVEKFQGKRGHDALKEVQRESGVCCDTIELDLGALGIVPVKQPRSIAFDEMEEDEFRVFFDGITAYIAEHYTSVMLDDVRAEFWTMVQGEAA